MGAREDLSIVIRGSTEQLANDLARGASLLRGFAKSVEQNSPKAVVKADGNAIGVLKQTAAAAGEARAGIAGAASSLAGFGVKALVAGGSLLALEAGFSGIGSALELVKSSVVMVAEVEQTTIAMETLLGSVEKTTEVMSSLRKFAADTPFSNKEVTNSARQLLAYGVAADDLIPTLRTLGTIAAGASKPLGEEVYRWGTVKVAGRAMQQDVNQYTTAGHDVLPGIAKSLNIDLADVRKYTEDSRVGANELSASLENLANVKYAGLLERQADSLKGSWEQLTDAWDRVKLKFGQVIVKEMGLRGAAKDVEGFAGKVESILGGEGFARGVRLLGDFGHAVAHVVSEFGSATFTGVNIFGDMAKDLPGIKNTLDTVNTIIQDMKSFKVDPQMLTALAVEGSQEILSLAGSLAMAIGTLGDKLEKSILQPMINAIGDINKLRGDFDKGVNGAKDLLTGKTGRDLGQRLAADRPLVILRDLMDGKPLMPERAPPGFQAIEEADNDLVKFGKTLANLNAQLKEKGDAIKQKFNDDFTAKAIDAEIARAKRLSAEQRRFDVIDRGQVGPLAALGGFGVAPLHQLAAGMPAFSADMSQTAGLGALGGNMASAAAVVGTQRTAPAENRLPRDERTPVHLVELSHKLNPAHDIKVKLADLDSVLANGSVTKEQHDRGRGDLIRDVGEKMGLGGRKDELASGVLVGSSEDAKLLAKFRSGGDDGKDSVESLLQMIYGVLGRIEKTNGKMAEVPPPREATIRE